MSQITYHIADQNNGRFESYDTKPEAEAAYERWVEHGIAAEKENQDETGYTDSEIENRVRAFYSIEEKEKTWTVLDSGSHKPTGDTVKIGGLEVTDMAYATSRCLNGTDDFWASAEYIERMVDSTTGKRYDVVYLFEDADMTDADGEPLEEENYPWDDNHIARVFAVYDDER